MWTPDDVQIELEDNNGSNDVESAALPKHYRRLRLIVRSSPDRGGKSQRLAEHPS